MTATAVYALFLAGTGLPLTVGTVALVARLLVDVNDEITEDTTPAAPATRKELSDQ